MKYFLDISPSNGTESLINKNYENTFISTYYKYKLLKREMKNYLFHIIMLTDVR